MQHRIQRGGSVPGAGDLALPAPQAAEPVTGRERERGREEGPLPGVLLQEPPDEVLGQLAGGAEELGVKVVVHGRHVPQRLLLGVSQEGRRPAQTVTTATGTC